MPQPTMPTGQHAFCWNQLTTHDVEASCAFYGELLGWRFVTRDLEGRQLTVVRIA